MFMYMETVDGFDPETDFPRHMAMHPRCQEWGNKMSSFQVPAPEAPTGAWWAYMEEVFDFEAQCRDIVVEGEGGRVAAGDE